MCVYILIVDVYIEILTNLHTYLQINIFSGCMWVGNIHWYMMNISTEEINWSTFKGTIWINTI